MRYEKQNRKAALFFFEGYISLQPSVINAATRLCESGYRVDLFYMRPPYPLALPDLPSGVRLLECVSWRRTKLAVVRQFLRKLRRKRADPYPNEGSPTPMVNADANMSALTRWRLGAMLALDIIQFGWFCRRRLDRIDLAIAFDMTGTAAMALALPRRVPYIYWSLETLLLCEARDPVSRFLKRHELRRMRKAKAIVTPAPERTELLARDTALPAERTVEVSNGPLGLPPPNLPRDFFRGRFAIPPSSKIVLSAGMIMPAVSALELAEASASWPPGFTLAFHSHVVPNSDDPYIAAVRSAGGERVILSLTPVPFEKVDLVYAGAEIGILCYERSSANYAFAWASSGKLRYYLRSGMPIVIVSDEMPSLIRDWSCGIWVHEIDGVGEALTQIAADYDRLSRNARDAYSALFDFAKGFETLMRVVGNGLATAPDETSPEAVMARR